MDFSLNEEQKMVQQTVRDFVNSKRPSRNLLRGHVKVGEAL